LIFIDKSGLLFSVSGGEHKVCAALCSDAINSQSLHSPYIPLGMPRVLDESFPSVVVFSLPSSIMSQRFCETKRAFCLHLAAAVVIVLSFKNWLVVCTLVSDGAKHTINANVFGFISGFG
jgi:hypothetical protein